MTRDACMTAAWTLAGMCLVQSLGAQGFREECWPSPAESAAGTPAPWHFGEVVAVSTLSTGNILVLHRGAHPILEFTVEGGFVRAWPRISIANGKVTQVPPPGRTRAGSRYTVVHGPAGCQACGAHSIRVDPDGRVWIVDAASHVVLRLDEQGSVELVLGTRGIAGTDRDHFNLPTDVAFAPDGSIYVSDGYGSARVVKFSSTGEYLLQWGKRGTGPGEFGLPHNLAVDKEGRVYVTDRDNERIQVFDPAGRFLAQWRDVGGVSTLYLTADRHIWTGGVLRNLEGRMVSHLPGDPGGHGTTVAADGSVLIAQLSGVVQRFVPE